MRKIPLHITSGPSPTTIELGLDRILCNDVILPDDYNPHNVRLWIISNEFGAMGAVWADCEQDALDVLVDADLAAGILVDEPETEEERESLVYLGNYDEPANLDNCTIVPVAWSLARESDVKTLLLFALAKGACADTLADV
jgi:hypothetical protein